MKQFKNILFIIMFVVSISSAYFTCMTIKLINEQLNINKSANDYLPSIRVNIHYTALDGSRKEMITYDNMIDVGNEVINTELTKLILDYRSEHMICSCNLLDITVAESEDEKANIKINWPDSIHFKVIGNIHNKDT